MASLTVPVSDYGYYLNFTVQDSAGAAYDLTGLTVTLKVLEKNGKLIMSGVCSLVVAANGTCRYSIAQNDLIRRGEFDGKLEMTSVGKVESTDYFTLVVK